MTQHTEKHRRISIEFERRPARGQVRASALAPTAIGLGLPQIWAVQLMLAVIAALAIPMTWLVPTELVLPSISIVAVGLAFIIAAIAWSTKAAWYKESNSVNLRDVAGVFALIGFGAAMVSEPESVVQLIAGRAS